MFRNLFFGNQPPAINDESHVPEIEDDQLRNPFDHIHILTNHTELVHHVIKLDNRRILSCGQDKKGVIWDCKHGNVICELIGHTRTISCAVHVNQCKYGQHIYESVVVTVSADQSIRIWDALKGDCLDVIIEHRSAIKCIYYISGDEPIFITGGQNICMWNGEMKLQYQYQRSNLDYIHSIVMVQNNKRMVTASDQKYLSVYEIFTNKENGYTIEKLKDLSPHRQSITVLVKLGDAMFTCASMDGEIAVWSSFRFNILRKFNHYENFMSEVDHTFPYSVQSMLPVDKNYLIAACGCGFLIFDISKGDCLIKMTHAHHSPVTCVELLNEGEFLVTSSSDASVRLWASPVIKKSSAGPKVFKSQMSTLLGHNLKEDKLPSSQLKLDLVGICHAHSNSVQSVIGLGREGFTSFGSDGLIILWKNGHTIENEKDEYLRSILKEKCWID